MFVSVSKGIIRFAVRVDNIKLNFFFQKAKLLEATKSKGNDAYRRGNYTEAHELYTEALAVDPFNKATNAKLYSNRANVCEKVSMNFLVFHFWTSMVRTQVSWNTHWVEQIFILPRDSRLHGSTVMLNDSWSRRWLYKFVCIWGLLGLFCHCFSRFLASDMTLQSRNL